MRTSDTNGLDKRIKRLGRIENFAIDEKLSTDAATFNTLDLTPSLV